MSFGEAHSDGITVSVQVEYAENAPVKEFPIFPALLKKRVDEVKKNLVELMCVDGIDVSNVAMFLCIVDKGGAEEEIPMNDNHRMSHYEDSFQKCASIVLRKRQN